MTEAEWLACGDPIQLLRRLYPGEMARELILPGELPRKPLLLTAAYIRRLWGQLPQATRTWIECVERVADGQAYSDGQHATLDEGWDTALSEALHWEGCGRKMPLVAVLELFSARCWFDGYLGGDAAWHAEGRELAAILREVCSNPFRPVSLEPSWLTPTVSDLATAASEERALPSGELDPTRLAILADALEEAGSGNAEVLGHLRSPGPHFRGCWALDLLLGKD